MVLNVQCEVDILFSQNQEQRRTEISGQVAPFKS